MQLDGKLMEKIVITTQSLKMLNTQKSRDSKLTKRGISIIILHNTYDMFFFWNGFQVKCVFLVLLSNIAVGISLYEILHCISLQLFLCLFFLYMDRSNAYVI